MSNIIVKPFLTEDMVIRIFEYLCYCEIRKIFKIFPEHQDGLQDGYVMCLVDLFGETDEETVEKMFDEEKSYTHVIDRILKCVSYQIEDLQSRMQKEEEQAVAFEYLKEMQSIVKSAVSSYFMSHKQEMIDAIKYL